MDIRNMNQGEKAKWLENEIDTHIAYYEKQRTEHRRIAVILRMSAVLLAATITVLLGVKTSSQQTPAILGNIALFLGASITVVNAFDAFFSFRSLYILEELTWERLKDLKRDLVFYRAGREADRIEEDFLSEIKIHLDHILQNHLEDWLRVRGIDEKRAALRAELKMNDTNPPMDEEKLALQTGLHSDVATIDSSQNEVTN